MAPFIIDWTFDANLTSVCVNMTICSLCLIFRLCQKRRSKTKLTKFMILGILSIVSAVLYCAVTLIQMMMRYYSYREFPVCKIVYISSRTFYALHRAFLYAFVAWRIEVVNSSHMLSRSTIRIAKFIIVSCSIFLVLGMIFFIESKSSRTKCKLNVNVEFLIAGWILDIIICVLSSWLFLRPLLKNLKALKDYALKKTVEKEALCIGISLFSTVTTAVCNYLFVGIMGITIGIDCSITSCCLVALATPVNHLGQRRLFCCVRSMDETSSKQSRSKTEMEILAVGTSSPKMLTMDTCSMLAKFEYPSTSSDVEIESEETPQ